MVYFETLVLFNLNHQKQLTIYVFEKSRYFCKKKWIKINHINKNKPDVKQLIRQRSLYQYLRRASAEPQPLLSRRRHTPPRTHSHRWSRRAVTFWPLAVQAPWRYHFLATVLIAPPSSWGRSLTLSPATWVRNLHQKCKFSLCVKCILKWEKKDRLDKKNFFTQILTCTFTDIFAIFLGNTMAIFVKVILL